MSRRCTFGVIWQLESTVRCQCNPATSNLDLLAWRPPSFWCVNKWQNSEKYRLCNYCGMCIPQKCGSTDNVLFTCILAKALQSSSYMQSMDVNYLAHIKTCRYVCRVVIWCIQHKWKLKLVSIFPLNSWISNFKKSCSVFPPCYMHRDKWMERKRRFNRYSAGRECVTTCDTKSQNQISWLGRTGKQWEKKHEHICARTHANR